MSQSQTELDRLRMELVLVKQSAADALAELRAEKENSVQACIELKSARESLTQAQAELESIRRELKKSWELEAKARTQIQKGKEELESMFLFSTLSFCFVKFPSDLCLTHRTPRRILQAVRALPGRA